MYTTILVHKNLQKDLGSNGLREKGNFMGLRDYLFVHSSGTLT